MNTLPAEILLTIFEFIPVRTLYTQVVYLNKEISEIIQKNYFLVRLIRIMTGSSLDFSQEKEGLYKILRKSQKTLSKKPLNLTGFGTTGGVDDDLSQYWVDNLFQFNSSSYCSRISAGFTCVSVLKSTQKSAYSDSQQKYRKIAAKIVRKNPILNKLITTGKNSKENLLPLEEYLFMTAWNDNPFIINSFSLDYSERTRQRVYKELRESQINIARFRKDSENILFRQIDHELVSEIPILGFIRGVYISREGDYSCPGNTFWAFASETYIECCKENFHLFETAKNAEEVKELSRTENLFQISDHQNTGKFEYILFKKSQNQFKPLIWFKFLDDTITKVEISLNEIQVGKYFYVTFTDVLNKMQEMGDNHQDTNIDFTYIVPYGFEAFTK